MWKISHFWPTAEKWRALKYLRKCIEITKCEKNISLHHLNKLAFFFHKRCKFLGSDQMWAVLLGFISSSECVVNLPPWHRYGSQYTVIVISFVECSSVCTLDLLHLSGAASFALVSDFSQASTNITAAAAAITIYYNFLFCLTAGSPEVKF